MGCRVAASTCRRKHDSPRRIRGVNGGRIMSKAKLLVASMLAVFAVAAVAAASASATTQFELEKGHASDLFAAEPKVSEGLLLKAAGEPEISCEKVELEKGEVKNDSTLASFKSSVSKSSVNQP